MTLSILGTMLIYMTVCSYTPGPGNILAMNTTTQFGWKRGRALILGICCGYLFVQFLCTFAFYGLNTVLEPALHVLKFIGGVYMVWLAVSIIRSSPPTEGEGNSPSFQKGFLLQLVNVKIYFYSMTLLTAYLIPHIENLTAILLAGIGVVIFGSIACFVWAVLGLRMQEIYATYYKVINFILGLFLLYCAWDIVTS